MEEVGNDGLTDAERLAEAEHFVNSVGGLLSDELVEELREAVRRGEIRPVRLSDIVGSETEEQGS